jgi:hypothetical protein
MGQCTFCERPAVTMMNTKPPTRFCETHWHEYGEIGEAWEGGEELPSTTMKKRYGIP